MRSNNGFAMVLADSLHAVTSQCEFHTKQYVVKTIEIRDYAKAIQPVESMKNTIIWSKDKASRLVPIFLWCYEAFSEDAETVRPLSPPFKPCRGPQG